MDGLAAVQARIAQIESFSSTRPRSVSPATVEWSSAAAATGLTDPGGAVQGTSAPAGALDPAVLGPASTGGTPAGAAVIEQARKYLGVPYLWGGTDPTRGLDCSGFAQLVFRSQGIELPRVSSQQATAGRAVGSLAQAQPGDLLFFDYSPSRPGIDHVGIYVGDGQMIAAPQPGDVVKLQSAGDPTLIRRMLPDASTSSGR